MSQPYVHLPELFEYRAASARRRAEAFCDAPEYVLGIEVKPLSPATFSMLLAVENHFATGGPIREDDVRQYLWFHSPLFVLPNHPEWRARKRRALRLFLRQLNQPWRRVLGLRPSLEYYHATLAIATADITAKLDAAFADAPSKAGRPGKPLATMEAFLIHEFSAAYRWAPEYTRHTALRKLTQLHRCIRAARGEEVGDDGEEKIWANYLRRKNDALRVERERAAAAKEGNA